MELISSASAYFFKKQMKEGHNIGMKEIFSNYKNLDETQRKAFFDEYNKV
jgi:hypothetical protein